MKTAKDMLFEGWCDLCVIDEAECLVDNVCKGQFVNDDKGDDENNEENTI